MYRHTAAVVIAAFLVVLGAFASLPAQPPAGDDLASLQEKTMKTAILKVAPSVVRIETSGGTDLVGSGPKGPQIRKGVGPTTGLVVGTDGYVISSAFNFVNKPSAIFVGVPGFKDHFPAKVVATDKTRMLTLLKIEATGLPVPTAAPRKEIKVGQSALALGRTWASHDQPPSVSVGIVSALDRIWGKALQTDAKVSPVNYGGPLVDIQGRVLGVLVPASPRAEDETAGIEWYDSGIGFAVPLEDINAVIPRLKEGKDLQRGLLGIVPKSQDLYGTQPTIATVLPKSAAAIAGFRPGDTILEIGGMKIDRQAQVMHVLGTKYEGDVVSVKLKRGSEELNFPNLKLTGVLPALAQSFIGILPMRDDPELGVLVRYVYPGSPAEKAGIKVGDRIMSAGQGKTPQAFSGRDELYPILGNILPGTEINLEVRRPDAKDLETLKVKLDEVPEGIPDNLPQPATLKKALEPRKLTKPPPMPPTPAKKEDKKDEKKEEKKPPETGVLERTNAAGDHRYWVYVPETYDPNISYALLVWLHPPGKGKEIDKNAEAIRDAWESYCDDNHIIMVGPRAENESAWLASEAESVREAIQGVMSQYTIDKQRIVAHGLDSGGQMAFRIGFYLRDLIRGVAAAGAVLPMQPNENQVNQRLAFFVIAGDKDPLIKHIEESKTKLAAMKYSVVFKKIANKGREYPDEKVVEELVRWIDSLDRQ